MVVFNKLGLIMVMAAIPLGLLASVPLRDYDLNENTTLLVQACAYRAPQVFR
jgi:hypothetical protein